MTLYFDWLPMVVVLVFACIWVAGCTLSTSNGSAQATTNVPTRPAEVTITVRERTTPTPTPTGQPPIRVAAQATEQPPPTTYTIEADDTLLDIAFQFGVTVEDLQIANPNVDPRALQIGQQIMIPATGTDPRAVGIPAPPPPPLPLTSPTCYQTTTESLICLGLVENDREQSAERLQVAVQVFGNNSEILAEQLTTIEQGVVRPGESAPYRVLLRGLDESDVAGVTAALSSGTLTDNADKRFVPITVENAEWVVRDGQFIVTAQFVNPTDTPAEGLRAVVTLTNANGTVHGYRVWMAQAPLPAAGRLPAEIAVLPLGLNGTPLDSLTYTLHVEARRPFQMTATP